LFTKNKKALRLFLGPFFMLCWIWITPIGISISEAPSESLAALGRLIGLFQSSLGFLPLIYALMMMGTQITVKAIKAA